MPVTATRFASRVLQPFTKLARWNLQRGSEAKEHARSNRRQQGERKRSPIDSNVFQKRKVECMEMCQLVRAHHGENETQRGPTTRKSYALGQHLSQQPKTLQGLVDKVMSPRRFLVLLLSGFAGFALLLASLGIYALISYSVNQRTKEIGIRMAMGASSWLVQRDVLTRTLRLTLAGVALGTLGSFVLSKWIESLLFGTTPTDPTVFSGVIFLLTAVALVAAYGPARRASRIDPMQALRTE